MNEREALSDNTITAASSFPNTLLPVNGAPHPGKISRPAASIFAVADR